MNNKKIIFVISLLAIFGFLFNFDLPNAKAMTVEEILAQIAQLQEQLARLQGQPATWCHDFNLNLEYGDSYNESDVIGKEVQSLQTALIKEGFDNPSLEAEKANGEFGEFTAAAVVSFQEKYTDDISKYAGYGIRHSGFIGSGTRAKLNELYGCGFVPEAKLLSFEIIPSCRGEDGWIHYPKGAKAIAIAKGKGLSKVEFRISYLSGDDILYDKSEIVKTDDQWEAILPDTLYVGDDFYAVAYDYLGRKVDKISLKAVKGIEEYPEVCMNEGPPSHITVLFPNGGEKLIQGNTYTIAWTAPSNVKTVRISVWWESGLKTIRGLPIMSFEILADAPNTGTWSWKVLPANGSTYSIHVSTFDTGTTTWTIIDESDDYFSIVSEAVPCTDSDGGKNYYVKGTTSQTDANPLSFQDFCDNSVGGYNLREYYCDSNDEIQSVQYDCPSGCDDGVCISR